MVRTDTAQHFFARCKTCGPDFTDGPATHDKETGLAVQDHLIGDVPLTARDAGVRIARQFRHDLGHRTECVGTDKFGAIGAGELAPLLGPENRCKHRLKSVHEPDVPITGLGKGHDARFAQLVAGFKEFVPGLRHACTDLVERIRRGEKEVGALKLDRHAVDVPVPGHGIQHGLWHDAGPVVRFGHSINRCQHGAVDKVVDIRTKVELRRIGRVATDHPADRGCLRSVTAGHSLIDPFAAGVAIGISDHANAR